MLAIKYREFRKVLPVLIQLAQFVVGREKRLGVEGMGSLPLNYSCVIVISQVDIWPKQITPPIENCD